MSDLALGPFWRSVLADPAHAASPDDATFDEKRTLLASDPTVREPPITAVRALPPLAGAAEPSADLELLVACALLLTATIAARLLRAKP